MPKVTTNDLKKTQARTIALMRFLMRRVGASNANKFAGFLTNITKDRGWSDMQESKKWYPFVRGNIKREPIGALRLLSQLFPDADDLYRCGPGGIWSALWGTINEQVSIMRAHPECRPQEPLEVVLTRVEKDAYLGSTSESQFEEFVRAVALYGYLVAVDPYGRTMQGNGFGRAYCAYTIVKRHLCEQEIVDELNTLGIYDAFCAFLADIERARIGVRPQWVFSIECGEVDERLRLEIEAQVAHRLTRWAKWLSKGHVQASNTQR